MAALLVRADAGPAIGGGHVMRCLAVAAAFREQHGVGAAVSFVRAAGPRDGFDTRIEALGAAVHRLPGGLDPDADARATAALARTSGATWVLVDGYTFDGGYERLVASHGLRVAALDDHAHTRHEAELIVNPGLGARAEAYGPVPRGTRVLAGPEYALIRPEFWPLCGVVRRGRGALSRVLVTLGASDPERLVPRVIAGLRQLPELEVRVLLGGADPSASESEALCQHAGFEVFHDATDMPGHMLWADLAISGAGGTLLELLLVGTPALAAIVAENQRAGADAARARGLARLLGAAKEVTPERVRDEVASLVAAPARAAEMALLGQATVDGHGARRVCVALPDHSVTAESP